MKKGTKKDDCLMVILKREENVIVGNRLYFSRKFLAEVIQQANGKRIIHLDKLKSILENIISQPGIKRYKALRFAVIYKIKIDHSKMWGYNPPSR